MYRCISACTLQGRLRTVMGQLSDNANGEVKIWGPSYRMLTFMAPSRGALGNLLHHNDDGNHLS